MMNAAWVVWIIKGGGDTQTLLTVLNFFELPALTSGGDVKLLE